MAGRGLLIYLKPQDQDQLFDNISALSAPGSMIATEFVSSIADFSAERARTISDPFRDHGVDVDLASLVYTGPRNHVLDYLGAKGWQLKACPWQNCSGAAAWMCPLQTTTPSSSAAAPARHTLTQCGEIVSPSTLLVCDS